MPEIAVRFDLPDDGWYDALRRSDPDVIAWAATAAVELVTASPTARLRPEDEQEELAVRVADELAWYAETFDDEAAHRGLLSGLLFMPDVAASQTPAAATLVTRLVPRRWGLLAPDFERLGKRTRREPDVLDLRRLQLDTGAAWRVHRLEANPNSPGESMEVLQHVVRPHQGRDLVSVVMSWAGDAAGHQSDQYAAAADAVVRTLTIEVFSGQ